MAQQTVVALRDVAFSWDGSHGTAAQGFALHVPVLEIAAGERVLLTGPSGGGKSTLLGLVSGTLRARSGTVRVLGEDLGVLSGPARDRLRAERMGVVFQSFNLLPYLGLVDNVTLSLRFAPRRRARAQAKEGGVEGEARRLLARLGLDAATLQGRAVARLSTGQQQRVAAARALIGAPDLVIADEPTSALDEAAGDAFLDLLFAQAEAAGAALLVVSHETRLRPRFVRAIDIAAFARNAERSAA